MIKHGNKQRESIVAIAKSVGVEYDKVNFKDLLVQVIEHLKDANIPFPHSGTVFIKPNVVIGSSTCEGITTDPHFISALIELLKESGVKKVFVGDSPASYLKSLDTFQITGMDSAVRKAGGIIVNIDDPKERVIIPLPESDILESLTVPRQALEADCLINFGKLKTHRIGSFTCCVKNWVGLIDQEVRLQNHQTRLPKLISELHQVLPEDICFGDGIIVGEGDGPDICQPRFLGVLLASNDPVALDVIGAQLLGIDHNELIFPWTAHLDGIGEIDSARIKVISPIPEKEIAISVKKPLEVIYNRFPCHIVLGGLCEGCFAWFMGPALFWVRDGIWELINKNVGTPTVMLGHNAVDRNFEKHLNKGPYFVVGDCTPVDFQKDPRNIFIPGCCPGPAIPNTILKTCGIISKEDLDESI